MDNNNSDIIFTENLKQRTTMGTKSSNTVTGVWPAKQPSSLILNFFEVKEIVGKNTQKVKCLLRNIKNEITSNNIKDNVISVTDHGVSFVFFVTLDVDGNYGLLFNEAINY